MMQYSITVAETEPPPPTPLPRKDHSVQGPPILDPGFLTATTHVQELSPKARGGKSGWARVGRSQGRTASRHARGSTSKR
eukprot:1161099-Pelagomonas_calceolata.AAC.6